jgi:hypothetical protein
MDPITPCLKGFSKICLYKSTISTMVLMGILKKFLFKKGFLLRLSPGENHIVFSANFACLG